MTRGCFNRVIPRLSGLSITNPTRALEFDCECQDPLTNTQSRIPNLPRSPLSLSPHPPTSTPNKTSKHFHSPRIEISNHQHAHEDDCIRNFSMVASFGSRTWVGGRVRRKGAGAEVDGVIRKLRLGLGLFGIRPGLDGRARGM